MLDWIVEVGVGFVQYLCMLGLVTILWLALLGEWVFQLGQQGFMFETTLLTAFVDFNWLETALSQAGLIGREFKTLTRFAFIFFHSSNIHRFQARNQVRI